MPNLLNKFLKGTNEPVTVGEVVTAGKKAVGWFAFVKSVVNRWKNRVKIVVVFILPLLLSACSFSSFVRLINKLPDAPPPVAPCPSGTVQVFLPDMSGKYTCEPMICPTGTELRGNDCVIPMTPPPTPRPKAPTNSNSRSASTEASL